MSFINHKNKIALVTILITIFSLYLYTMMPSVTGVWGPGNNSKNYSVHTMVNVTEAAPEILNITCNNGTTVTLRAGWIQNVSCRITVQDFNGGNTINGTNGSIVNGSIFYQYNTSTDADDNNVHYTNSSCTYNNSNGWNSTWDCGFSVWYYANNGTWYMNATVTDNHQGGLFNYTRTGLGNFTIGALYALNVTDTIDFGSMSVGDTSPAKDANVTNFGNMNINITVFGFGGDSKTAATQNLAMICEQRNLSMSNERWALSNMAFGGMNSITPTANSMNFTIPQQTNDAQQETNQTYWKLYIDPAINPFGACNGTVVFSAMAP